MKSAALGERLVHCPAEGVIHVTSNVHGKPHLTGLTRKAYPTAEGAATVNSSGEICRCGNASVCLTADGILQFLSNGKQVIAETSTELKSTAISGTEYPSVLVHWDSATADAIYGLGQYQDGALNARGVLREGHQKNLENCVPLWGRFRVCGGIID